ncbi:MAG: type IV conjugative transfer system protein TraE [Alphaproteobacteria bacterium]|nr:type IV conjugative transfer system protein TraE [Alphaproteobacteria bacterium]
MNFNAFMQDWSGTKALNRWLLGSVAALSLVVLMQTFALLGRDRVVVLVPPELSAEAEIARSQANHDYTKAWGLHIASLIGNVTPGNHQFIKDSVYPLLAPAIHAEVTTIIERQLDQLDRDRVSLRFEPRRVVQKDNRVFVFGYGVTTAVGSTAGERKKRTYEVELEIERHRPVIRHLMTYEGEPRDDDRAASIANEDPRS